MEGIKDTSTLTFRKLLGNGLTYQVPKFQRDYSWTEEEWDDFWQDICNLTNDNEQYHYMGYLVLQTADDKLHKIIDGQQRITTISLLILSILKRLQELENSDIDAKNNKIRREQLHYNYIGYLDPVSLVAINKLTLNQNNNNFYSTYIVPLENIPIRGTNTSEKLIKACFEWFYKKINKEYAVISPHKTGELLTKFIDKMVDRLYFTVIQVGDELNAYKVFETLNARGVQLSSADLLKNYLFSIVDADNNTHEKTFAQLEYFWTKILDNLGSSKLPEFLRYYWNSMHKTTRKNELFKAIRTSIKDKKQVFALLRDLDSKAHVYMALLNPEDEFWNDIQHTQEIRESLRELKIYGAKQPLPLLISAYDNLGNSDFLKILKICSVIYMRYNIIGGFNPNEQEKIFNNIAVDIVNNNTFSKEEFSEIYPSDNEFAAIFANKELLYTTRNKKIIKYILAKIEYSLSPRKIDLNSETSSIEHILPQTPNENWDWEDSKIENDKNRLGNLTLLEKSINRSLENKDFNTKRTQYDKSTFEITKQIVENYSDWGIEEIISRQKWMANKAKSIWRIDF